MGSDHLSRLRGLVTCRVQDRAAVEQYLCDLRLAIVDLRARLAHTRQRLAVAEARVVSATSVAARVGAMVIEAHDQIAKARLEAERGAGATVDAPDAARAVLDFKARPEDTGETSSAARDFAQIAAS